MVPWVLPWKKWCLPCESAYAMVVTAYAPLFSKPSSILTTFSRPMDLTNHLMYAPGRPLNSSKHNAVSSTNTGLPGPNWSTACFSFASAISWRSWPWISSKSKGSLVSWNGVASPPRMRRTSFNLFWFPVTNTISGFASGIWGEGTGGWLLLVLACLLACFILGSIKR